MTVISEALDQTSGGTERNQRQRMEQQEFSLISNSDVVNELLTGWWTEQREIRITAMSVMG